MAAATYGGTMDDKKRISIAVKTNSGDSRIDFDAAAGIYRAFLKASPEKGKANTELLKLLRKTFGARAAIVSGAKSRRKTVEFI